MKQILTSLCLTIAVLIGSAGVSWSDESNTGPSFDCDKASTPTEYAICASDDLSALDRVLADAYKVAKGLDNSTTLRDEQRQWNKERSSTCGDDVECLSRMYHERIKVLCGDDVECLSHKYLEQIYADSEERNSDEIGKKFLEDKHPYIKLQFYRFSACSKDTVKIPLNEELNEFAIVSTDLSYECLGKISRQISRYLGDETRKRLGNAAPPKYQSNLKIEWKQFRGKSISYEVASILSPFNLGCGERCRYLNEDLVKIKNKYYFLIYSSESGINSSVINKDLILFKALMGTHDRNLILNRTLGKLGYFPNGDLEFLEDAVIVRAQKSYFEGGGAFWHNSKRDYSGNVIEYLDRGDGTCVDSNKFQKTMKTKLISMGKTQLCVWVK